MCAVGASTVRGAAGLRRRYCEPQPHACAAWWVTAKGRIRTPRPMTVVTRPAVGATTAPMAPARPAAVRARWSARTCNVAGHCAGSDTDSASCTEGSDVCGWSGYGSWSGWSTDCGTATEVNAYLRRAGFCAGSDTETQTDDRGDGTCGWSDYGSWSGWSTDCGMASRSRTRTCNVSGHCDGSDTQREESDAGTAPAVGARTAHCGSCSTSCGYGTQTRYRTCNVSGHCAGSDSDSTSCSAGSDTAAGAATALGVDGPQSAVTRRVRARGPVRGFLRRFNETQSEDRGDGTCGWSSWGSYGSCSTSCGNGTQTRYKTCNVSGHCDGSSSDTASCSAGSDTCGWSSWSSWSGCSITAAVCRHAPVCNVGGFCSGSSTDTTSCTGSGVYDCAGIPAVQVSRWMFVFGLSGLRVGRL